MPFSCCRLIATCLLLIGFSNSAIAVPFVPTGVAPGSPYHLIFVTRDGRDGASGNIADYNAFVNSQAALNATLTGTNVGVTYFAVGSTAAVDAQSNALITAPVYNLNDEKVADSFADMWDSTLDAAILYDQFANPGFPDVFTGSNTAGMGITGSELGSPSPGSGLANFASSVWITDSNTPQSSTYAFYALSQPIFAPAAAQVPEPTSALLWLLAATSVCLITRSNRRCKNEQFTSSS